MSLPDRFQPVPKRLLSACVLGMALIAGGCQVRPLYSDPGPVASTSANVSGSVRSKLASVSINERGDRVTQEVRNNLIFLFGGGAGEPVHPAYTLRISVISQSLRWPQARAGEPFRPPPISGPALARHCR